MSGVGVLSGGNPLPAPIVVGPDTVPAAYAPDLGGHSQFGGYFIAATTLGEVQRNNLPPTVATGPAKKQLSIATYNVENLAPTDPASKFQALADGVVSNLADPDIIAVEEVQDNDGATDDGVVAADQTIAKLTAAVTAAGGPSYSSREMPTTSSRSWATRTPTSWWSAT